MNSHYPSSLPDKQQGVVLLMMVVIIILVAVSYLIAMQSVTAMVEQRQQVTRKVLKQAKQALLAYAQTRADQQIPSPQPGRYGYLPCPANNNSEGISTGSCGSRYLNALGWFPWKSLDMPILKDGNGNCLLYAVSSTYKWSPDAKMLNEDSPGMLQLVDESGAVVQGTTASGRVVAMVFSAGQALAGQTRINNANSECGYDTSNFGAYLDTYTLPSGSVINNSTVSSQPNHVDPFIHIVSATQKDVVNDQVLTITRDDVWPPIMRRGEFDDANTSKINKMRRLTEALARCLASYANDNNTHRLPLPAPLDLSSNGYRDNNHYTDISSGSYIGHYPFITTAADSVIPGTLATTKLFEKPFTLGQPCNSLPLSLPGNGTPANLRDSHALERQLWDNWKDHIFYAVSKDYAPSSSATMAACGDCIKVKGTKYAAAVIYSGKKLSGHIPPQIRQTPIAAMDIGVVADSKNNLANYIEVNNPAGTGKGDYTRTANDTIFCLTDTNPVGVVSCM